MTSDIRIDGERLWGSIMEMAQIGATANGGSHRLTLSDEDKIARNRFADWCADAGALDDRRRNGRYVRIPRRRRRERAPVGMGSHLDTQPYGGRFDGVFGVLAGLEVIRTLNDHGITTVAPLEVVNWTNEEGARFAPSMLASGVYGGVFDLDWAQSRKAVDSGAALIDELKRIGYYGEAAVTDHEFSAFFECHIEQGPILDSGGTAVGVVDTAQGFRWYDITLEGFASHTGSTPMVGRRNALLGMARVVQAVDDIAHEHSPLARGTVGSQVDVGPGSRNVIPGTVSFTRRFAPPFRRYTGRHGCGSARGLCPSRGRYRLATLARTDLRYRSSRLRRGLRRRGQTRLRTAGCLASVHHIGRRP